MAEIVASVLIKIVIQKLPPLLQGEEFNLGKEFKQDIELLTDKLQIIQDFLSVADRSVVDTEFLKQAKDLSYDVEDCIDVLTLNMEREQALTHKGIVDKAMKLVIKTKTRYRISQRLDDLRSRVMAMSNKVINLRDKHKSETTVPTTIFSTPVDPPLPDLYADASSLVGVDGPRDELVKLLMDKKSESAERLKVVSIVGFGGLGKTTLAKEVYSATKEYFECGAWVSVSRNPNLKKLLIHILRQVDEDSHSSPADGERDERDLIRKIKASLQHKRYLLVVDDIWSSETWEIIKSGLPLDNAGSRVITTTRIYSVAESCCLHWNDYIYSIRPLSEMDSKTLFLRRIFGSEYSCPQELIDVSDKILKKCSGLPLAIVAVSSLFANKLQTPSTWQNVYDSIGSTLENMKGMENILLRSYYALPHHLKVCFLHLSVFPEDYVINRDSIVRRWIAEGLILENHRKPLEEEGESYLDELVNRNMIQPHYGNYDGKPEAYQIHDTILDLIKSKSIEENFVTLLDNGLPVSALHRKIRRLSIIGTKEDDILKAISLSHIRSLYIFGDVGPKLSFGHFTFLRVLDLDGCKDLKDHNVKDIPELVHLRYLSIRDTPISELPGQIGQLRYLTTLDLRDTNVQKLPRSVVQLQRLEHLLVDKMRFPEGIGKMAALSSLSQFDILQSETFVVEELGNLSALRKLVLWWFPDMQSNNAERCEHLAISLYRLRKLESLSIHGGDSSVDFFNHLYHPLRQLHRIELNNSCYLNKLPEWFRSLKMLAYACIDIKEVKNGDLLLLSQLPSLLNLSLSSRALPTEKLVLSSNGFPVLQEFHLHSVRADLTFEPPVMQKLEMLLLSFQVLPEERYVFSIGIDQFVFLKKIDIRIHGEGAAASQLLEAIDAAIKRAADKHPNRPILNIIALGNLVDVAVEGKDKEQEMGNLIDNAVKEGKDKEQDKGSMTDYEVEEGNKEDQEMGTLIDHGVKEGKEKEQEIEVLEHD